MDINAYNKLDVQYVYNTWIFDVFQILKIKGHMQRKFSKPQNFEKMKISIYKIDMQNVKSHRVL